MQTIDSTADLSAADTILLAAPACFEAARSGSSPKQFSTLTEALAFLDGSDTCKVRPWLRVFEPAISQSFLIIAGVKTVERRGYAVPRLEPSEQAKLSAWCADFNRPTVQYAFARAA